MSFYLRPISLIYGADATQARHAGLAGMLGGAPIGFSALELIEGRGKDAKRRIISYQDMRATSDKALQGLLANIEAPRTGLPGLEGDGPFVMGIVNVTPDSFSDGGAFENAGQAADFAISLVAKGADILDIGGESTRPGASPVPVEVELDRILPVIERLRKTNTPLSIDTRNAPVMDKAIKAGAHMINDVSALGHDPAALKTAQSLKVPVILMHAQGTPKQMQDNPVYEDVVLDVFDYLQTRIQTCCDAGMDKTQLIADPGIGFGKKAAHNLALLSNLSLFHALGVNLALGTSRKGFIGTVSGIDEPRERLAGSLASALTSVAQGAHIVRVHDVAETAQALAVYKAIFVG